MPIFYIDASKVQFITRVGTGSSSSSSPCSLTFNFAPKFVAALCYSDSYERNGTTYYWENLFWFTPNEHNFVKMDRLLTSFDSTQKYNFYRESSWSSSSSAWKSSDGKTLYWYGSDDSYSYNISGYVYSFLAFS